MPDMMEVGTVEEEQKGRKLAPQTWYKWGYVTLCTLPRPSSAAQGRPGKTRASPCTLSCGHLVDSQPHVTIHLADLLGQVEGRTMYPQCHQAPQPRTQKKVKKQQQFRVPFTKRLGQWDKVRLQFHSQNLNCLVDSNSSCSKSSTHFFFFFF